MSLFVAFETHLFICFRASSGFPRKSVARLCLVGLHGGGAKGQEEEKRISYQTKCTQVSRNKKMMRPMLRPRRPRRTSMYRLDMGETYNPKEGNL